MMVGLFAVAVCASGLPLIFALCCISAYLHAEAEDEQEADWDGVDPSTGLVAGEQLESIRKLRVFAWCC